MNYLRRLKPDNLPEKVTKKGALAVYREMILQSLFNILLGTITIGLLFFVAVFREVFLSGRIYAYLIGYAVFFAIAVIRQIPYNFRASLMVLLLMSVGTAALISYGLSGTGLVFLFASILLANLLFGRKMSALYDALGLVPVIAIGFLMLSGNMPLPPVSVMANSGKLDQWIIAGAVFVLAAGPIANSLSVVLQGMNNVLIERRKLTEDLENERASLELRVEQRSADLRKRVDQFDIASQIAREISGETNLENLLNRSANMIRDQFGFYHVGIFFNDEKNEFTTLRAATGEAGRAMLERNHRLKIGEIGMVGYAASRGEARISSNVSDDIVHYKNPLLPDTHSEMALPLRIRDVTIGVLDVQSADEDAFSFEDVRILQTIADQLSLAFEKTRLVDELRRSVEELEASYRTSTQKAWRLHLKNTRQKLAYRYRNSQLETGAEESPHGQEALTKGQPVLRYVPGKDEEARATTVLAVPIKLRNQVLGVVDIHFQGTNVSPDLISLIEGTVSRLAVSLENARLLEEIQYRAERERLVGEISSKVRAASDVDSVLKIAIQEIGRTLGVSEVMVQLRKDS
jgi:GAF domain-containing protein